MDDWLVWLQGKLGPMTFGAILGFVLQVLIFRPTNWMLAAERAAAAIVAAVLFTKPSLVLLHRVVPDLVLDREVALTTSAALLALGGVEMVRKARKRFLKTVGGEADE